MVGGASFMERAKYHIGELPLGWIGPVSGVAAGAFVVAVRLGLPGGYGRCGLCFLNTRMR